MSRRPTVMNGAQRPMSVMSGERATARHLPALLTCSEVAELLRTSQKAIYAMVERGQLPGTVRLGRRVLIREDALLDWLGQKSTPSPER